LLGGQRTDESEVRSQLSRTDTRILLMQEGGTLVASILLHCEGELGYVGMFAVRPSAQGKGLGRQLLAAAEQVLRDQFGATKVQMTVIRQRLALIAWYERRGYSLTGKTMPFPYGNERMGLPKRDDLEFVVLEKPLT
jgi:ribosomal protein S18 acetylase RimI-like enzyme